MSVVIVSSYDENLEQMVSREVYLSNKATCESCGNEADKKDFGYYGYDFNKKIYTGLCYACLDKLRKLEENLKTEDLLSVTNERTVECVCCGRKLPKNAFIEFNFAGNRELGKCLMCSRCEVPVSRKYLSIEEV